MNAEVQKEKDYFWLYVGSVAAILITIVVLIKVTESKKYEDIQKLQDEEIRMMNIRVLN